MKRISLLSLLMFASTTSFASDQPDVKKLDHGVYWSVVAASYVYYVDTVAQLCFVADAHNTSSALSAIPCKNVKKRPEWAQIINWE